MNIAIYNGDKKTTEEVLKTVEAFSHKSSKNWQQIVFDSPGELKQCINSIDVAILGIGENDGIAFAKALLEAHSRLIIIFVTSHSECLDDAFEIGAFRFFIKPLDSQRLINALLSAQKRILEETCYLYFKNSGTYGRICFDDIIYIEIENRKTIVVTENAIIYTDYKMSYWHNLLMKRNFAVPHNSFIVNLDKVTHYKKRQYLVLNNSFIINISRTKGLDFDNRYSIFLKDKHYIA